jgi:hypothetical protein
LAGTHDRARRHGDCAHRTGAYAARYRCRLGHRRARGVMLAPERPPVTLDVHATSNSKGGGRSYRAWHDDLLEVLDQPEVGRRTFRFETARLERCARRPERRIIGGADKSRAWLAKAENNLPANALLTRESISVMDLTRIGSRKRARCYDGVG